MAGIEQVAVIGAGVMGAAIAAHCANAGARVLLLDIVKPGEANRNAIAEAAIARLKKTDPSPLMGAAPARLIMPGNTEDDFQKLAQCDWIVEAVIERLDIKQDLYRRLDGVRKDGAIVSSNTSTIPLHELTQGLPERFTRNFCITHFFNPPRYMRLLEVVGAEDARFAALLDFADRKLGKSVVKCKDTPGFIANRIGTYWIQTATVLAAEMGLSVAEGDAVMGKPMGFPSTGVFGLMDLVGIDLGPHVNASLARLLPKSDPFHAMNRDDGTIGRLIAAGYTGNKGKGGFYRREKDAEGKRIKTALSLKAAAEGRLDWQPAQKIELPEIKAARKDLKALLTADTKAGRYAWGVLGRVLAYAASLIPEIADEVDAVDTAMRLGYTWMYGPFELIDRLGAAWVAEHLPALDVPVPPILRSIGDRPFYRMDGATPVQFGADGAYRPIVRAPGILLLDDIKRTKQPVLGNANASAWDIGDGVLCFEMHAEVRGTKRNMLDEDVLSILDQTLKLVTAQDYKALVLYNDDLRQLPHKTAFSQGANVGLAWLLALDGKWDELEDGVTRGQELYLAMRYAPFPIVAAPAGLALGGGCEMLLHSSAVQAYAESNIGLVEAGVGLVPGWGGCTTMLARWQADKTQPRGPIPAVGKVFEIVSLATFSKSAAEAKELKFLQAGDGITMNRERLLADAKARALSMVASYAPPEPPVLNLPGPSGKAALKLVIDGFKARGFATEHDVTVSTHLSDVLTGGAADYLDNLSERDVMALERKNFMQLIKTKESQARLQSIIETGRPLRN